jgi:hypothetical protein
MQTRTLDGLVFSRAEFLTLLAAINPPDLIGIDADSLIPSDTNQHKAFIAEGVEQLRARGFLTTQGDTHLINDELLLMAGVVGFPQMVTLVIKQTPELGLQQFTYYLAEGFVIEHTMPAPEQYRLASLPSLALWRDRLAFILPVAQDDTQPAYALSLPQHLLTDAQNAAQNGQSEQSFRLLTGAGVANEAAQALVTAMAEPVFSGSAAFLRTDAPNIVAARDLALLQGEESAWAIYQPEPDGPITVRTLAGDDVQVLLQELATSV